MTVGGGSIGSAFPLRALGGRKRVSTVNALGLAGYALFLTRSGLLHVRQVIKLVEVP